MKKLLIGLVALGSITSFANVSTIQEGNVRLAESDLAKFTVLTDDLETCKIELNKLVSIAHKNKKSLIKITECKDYTDYLNGPMLRNAIPVLGTLQFHKYL